MVSIVSKIHGFFIDHLSIIIIIGGHMGAITVECPKGSVVVVKHNDGLECPPAVSEVGSKLIPLLHLSYNMREIILRNIKAIKKSHSTVGNYSFEEEKGNSPPLVSPVKLLAAAVDPLPPPYLKRKVQGLVLFFFNSN
jgi:hypothetical protein